MSVGGKNLADIFVSGKLSAAVDNQPDKLWEGELERRRGSFVRRVVELLPDPGIIELYIY